jgi:hypothetical protein
MALLIAFLVLAVLISFAVTLAVGWIVIFPALLVLGILAWVGTAFVAGRPPSDILRRTKRADLLGPGGPDDPERAAR